MADAVRSDYALLRAGAGGGRELKRASESEAAGNLQALRRHEIRTLRPLPTLSLALRRQAMRHLRLCPPLLRRILRMAPTGLGRLLSAQGMHAFPAAIY